MHQEGGQAEVDLLLASQGDLPVEDYGTRPASSNNRAKSLSQSTLFPASVDLAHESFDAPGLAPKGIYLGSLAHQYLAWCGK